ncbi:undecaprenyl-diphosphate phosphatase [Blattabacterium cuenoti]|uniref:undecaprenyl-diphosphate phosphatase n=1 Tax=Blattabacterium cuenoti TaxID=1653831 RepID=UPI00163BEC3F|nr:undecaprenyl-diphosphate phosphatase [Blattabacterium cuenoti]
MNYIQSILLGIIEGITELFPVSSTGHMILAAYVMGILENKITNLFIISVQFGAVFSVVFLYRKDFFFQKWNFYLKIFLASLPVCFFGFLLNRKNNLFLDNPLVVAISLFIGGFLILKTENLYEKKNYKKRNNITYFKAIIIGLFQCLALIPGVSRSATTIVACMLQNVNRKETIEFSFFLSVPVIIIATCKKLFDYYYFKVDYLFFDFYLFFKEIELLLLGNIAAFFTAIITIKCFITYLNNFKLFGYYRIFLGIFFIILHYFKPIVKY